MSGEQFKDLTERKAIELDPDQARFIAQCFADLDEDEQRKVYGTSVKEARALTVLGGSKLASRANFYLDRDNVVASLIMNKAADSKMLIDEYGFRICNYNKEVVEKLKAIELLDARDPIVRFLESGMCETWKGSKVSVSRKD